MSNSRQTKKALIDGFIIQQIFPG